MDNTTKQKLYVLEYFRIESCSWNRVEDVPFDHDVDYLRRFVSHAPKSVSELYRVREVDEEKQTISDLTRHHNKLVASAKNDGLTERVHASFPDLQSYRVLLITSELADLNKRLREMKVDIVELSQGYYLYEHNPLAGSNLEYCGFYPQDVWTASLRISKRMGK